MKDNFEKSLAFLARDVSNLPGEGRGAYGLTRAVMEAARGEKVTDEELRGLGEREAAELMRRYYWYATGCDDLPSGVDYCAFCMAVVFDSSFLIRRWLQDVPEHTEGGKRAGEAIPLLGQRMLERLRYNKEWGQKYQTWTQLSRRVQKRAAEMGVA